MQWIGKVLNNSGTLAFPHLLGLENEYLSNIPPKTLRNTDIL